MPGRSPTTRLPSDDQSIRWREIRNWVSIGLSRAKSSVPVRIISLNSAALFMNRACTRLLMISVVDRKRKNSYLPQAKLYSPQLLTSPICGVCWNTRM